MGQSHRCKHRHRGSAFANKVCCRDSEECSAVAVLLVASTFSPVAALETRWQGLSDSTYLLKNLKLKMNFKCGHEKHPVGRAAATLWCSEALGTFSSYPAILGLYLSVLGVQLFSCWSSCLSFDFSTAPAKRTICRLHF